ncbi:MAG: hypothetical protein MZV64_30050 [Ignavibacteriales bacterium]|nr:hypothetical protein [Ignavibacteriales bacterium]
MATGMYRAERRSACRGALHLAQGGDRRCHRVRDAGARCRRVGLDAQRSASGRPARWWRRASWRRRTAWWWRSSTTAPPTPRSAPR